LQAPIFQTRWRWTVGRALALLRFSGGRKLAPQLQRMRAEDLLAAAFPMQVGCQDNHGGEDLEIPNHPYVQETMRDCLHEFLDLEGLQRVLQGLETGAITFAAVDTPAPSGLAQEILNVGAFGFLDDAPLEERRSRTVALRAQGNAAGPGVLDPEAVAAVRDEAWPQPETAEELHDLLLSLLWIAATGVAPEWEGWLRELVAHGRVVEHHGGWAAAERVELLRGGGTGDLAGAVWPGVARHFLLGSLPMVARSAGFDSRQETPASAQGVSKLPPVEFAGATPTADEAATARMVGGWMEILGPVTAAELSARLHLSPEAVETALLALEGQGRVFRGQFGWCERGLLARIHRRMVRRLRAEIEPVSPAVYERFLRRWQHLETGTRLHGLSGLAAVIEQMQGYEAAASAWEQTLLPARVADYTPALLDQLCLAGEVGWARLKPMVGSAAANGKRRVAPTRNSPITFFKRADAGWLLPAAGWGQKNGRKLSAAAEQVLATLERRGACFFNDLIEPGLVKSQVEDALWELVAAGVATADGFDNLRAFLDPKRRAGEGRGQMARPRHSAGRWALVREAFIGAGPYAAAPRIPLVSRPAVTARGGMLAPAWGPLGPKSALRSVLGAGPGAAEARDPLVSGPGGTTGGGTGEAELARAELAERQASQWLRRYGVIFKAGLEEESSAVGWYEVLLACRRLEARGEIRGGRFVTGFAGEQYALPQAVEALRAVRKLAPAAAAG
ncbi:MAG TPA: hypothetical protein VNF74_08960, partial [Terriglobales bacterium]|nr:hypothetical protein [Terriglobales bacterium]